MDGLSVGDAICDKVGWLALVFVMTDWFTLRESTLRKASPLNLECGLKNLLCVFVCCSRFPYNANNIPECSQKNCSTPCTILI